MIRTIPALLAILALVAASPSPSPAPPASRMLPGMPRGPHPAPPGASNAPSPDVTIPPPGAPGGPPAAGGAGATFELGVWTIHASAVDANFKSGEFSTANKVTMTRVGGDVVADRSDGNYKSQLVNLYGHVVMHDSTGDYGGHAKGGQSSPSTLTADKAVIDGKAKEYKATGNVHYVSADTNVTADEGTLNDQTHDLFLQGNVHVSQGPRTVLADTVHYNTVTGQAHAEGQGESGVTMTLPGQFSRGLATPKPIHVPKNPVVHPVASASP
jgi:LptA/(LptD N-terminal domain) LPS transport protein